jgi:hypothetical protein
MENTQGAHAPQGVTTPGNRWIADVPKNSREVVRVELSSFNGHELINFRVWYESGDGEMKPGRAGLALRVERLIDLQAAIAKAVAAARAEGTIS